jgi:lipoate-protein ligase B
MVNDDNDNVQQQQQQQYLARCRIQCQYEIFNELDETIIKTTKIFDASNGASEARVGLPVGVKSKKVCICICLRVRSLYLYY